MPYPEPMDLSPGPSADVGSERLAEFVDCGPQGPPRGGREVPAEPLAVRALVDQVKQRRLERVQPPFDAALGEGPPEGFVVERREPGQKTVGATLSLDIE